MSRLLWVSLVLVGCTGGQDLDQDGLTRAEELELGTDPNISDTDGDGLSDGQEVRLGTNPVLRDTDFDTLHDGIEVSIGTDPLRDDTDDDGMKDPVELAEGTDPLDPDTDGDGFLDGEEFEIAFGDPLRMDRWPSIEGRWPNNLEAAEEGGLSAEGWGLDEMATDLSGFDRLGNDVSLHQFYGHVVLVNVCAMWCGPCLAAADVAQELWLEHREDGLVIFEVVMEDYSQQTPDAETLEGYVARYELEFPVIALSEREQLGPLYSPGPWAGPIPFYALLDRELRVVDSHHGGGAAEYLLDRNAELFVD